MTYEIQIRKVDRQPIISIRAVVPTLELVQFFNDACNDMKDYLLEVGGRTVGPAMSLWHSAPGQIPGASDIETCLPIEGPVLSLGRIHYGELPAGLQAFTVHQGAYDDMVNAYDAVWQWIQEHEYEMDGPPRDVVLLGPDDTNDPSDYRTEIVYPVISKTQH